MALVLYNLKFTCSTTYCLIALSTENSNILKSTNWNTLFDTLNYAHLKSVQ